MFKILWILIFVKTKIKINYSEIKKKLHAYYVRQFPSHTYNIINNKNKNEK